MTINLKYSLIFLTVLLITPLSYAMEQDLHRLWDDRCIGCHGHAGEFARKFLSISNGNLQGKHHVKDLRLFLQNHYLSGHSVEPVYNMLLAQAGNESRFKIECSKCHDNAANFVRSSLVLRDDVLYGRDTGLPIREFLTTHRKLHQQDIEYYLQQLTRIYKEVKIDALDGK